MARTYKRDSRGRFAGGGGGGGGRPAARKAPRGTNRLTRDNTGKITGTGNGATARGGRLRTAGGSLRATQTARLKGAGGRLRGGAKGKPQWVPTTNAKGQVTGMRNKNAPLPSRGAVARAARMGRAVRNLNAAMKREGDGPASKASRSASVAKRAAAIYSGKVDPKAKTKARLTRTQDPEALRRRVKKIKDNTAKPAKAKARKISDAKASRIVARVDARRPALRAASGSARRNQNALSTYRRATDFLLAPSRRALKRGSQISANDSVRRAVANAKPRRRR